MYIYIYDYIYLFEYNSEDKPQFYLNFLLLNFHSLGNIHDHIEKLLVSRDAAVLYHIHYAIMQLCNIFIKPLHVQHLSMLFNHTH